MSKAAVLKKIIRAQLTTGFTAFGGPLANMSMMRTQFVEREPLVSPSRYLEGLALVKMLPGPVSTLLAVFLGSEIAGVVGGLVSAFCFIIPSFLMLLTICYFEQSLGPAILQSSRFLAAMNFVQIAVIAVIFQSCVKLFKECWGKKYLGVERKIYVLAFALLAGVLAFLKLSEFSILALSAIGGLGWFYATKIQSSRRLMVEPLTLFLVFFKAGLTVFGTGYMVLPVLQHILVDNYSWITQSDFLNSVAYGNLTPGPVVIASTYMGFKAAGFSGAAFATLGIFGGPILLMLTLGPIFRKFLGRPWIEGIMLGLLPAVSATIAVGAFQLGNGVFSVHLVQALVIAGAAFYLIEWRRVSPILVLGMAAVLGAVAG